MYTLKFKVQNKELKIISEDDKKESFIRGSFNIDKLEFDFSEEWDKLSKKVIYKVDDKSYAEAVIDNTAIVPKEVYENAGFIEISVVGFANENGKDTVVLPTNTVRKLIYDTNSNGGEPANLPDESSWNEYQKKIEDLAEEAKKAEANAKTSAASAENVKNEVEKSVDGFDENVEKKTAEFNKNAEEKTTEFNKNTEQSYKDIEALVNSKTNTSVLPNDGGSIKTKYRINKNGYASGDDTHYYPLCSFPISDGNNYASAIISGRVGGFLSSNMSYINALLWNRAGCGMSLIDIAGSAESMFGIWSNCDIVIYKNEDNSASVYLKCLHWYAFDINLEVFQKTATIDYTGNYQKTEPTGTLVVQASTSNKRLELVNEKLLLNGKELVLKEDIPTKTSDLTNDSSYTTEDELNNKVDKVEGKGLSSNDYTTEEKTKLEGIEAGAEANTISSVNGKTGAVTLNANDVGALPDTTGAVTMTITFEDDTTATYQLYGSVVS